MGCDGSYDAVTGVYTTGPISADCEIVASSQLAVNLVPYTITATSPSIVTMIQRVVDRTSGEPVTVLEVEDFIVEEDNAPIVPREAFLDLEPIDQIPYQLDTVLMLDVSVSLTAADLVEVKAAAAKIVDNLIENQRIAVYVFDDTIRMVSTFSSDKEKLKAAIDGITGGGPSTNLYGAVADGFSRWDNSFSLSQVNHGALILITDGNDSAAKSTLDAALSVKGEKDFFALTVGNEINLDPLVQLVLGEKLDVITDADRELASKRLFSVNDYSEVEYGLQQITAEVERLTQGLYFLYYATPKRAGDHSVTISIENNLLCSELDVNCVTSLTGSFDATGFTNVMPELLFAAPKDALLPGESYELSARVRWSNPPFNFMWTLENLDGQMSLAVDSEDSSKSLLSIASGTQLSEGAVKVEVAELPDLSKQASLQVGIPVRGPDGSISVDSAINLQSEQTIRLTAEISCAQCRWSLEDPSLATLSQDTGESVQITGGTSTGATKLTVRDPNTGMATTYAVELGFQVGSTSEGRVAASYRTFAIKADGSLWRWGANEVLPIQVGTESNWVKVADNIGLQADGTLWSLRNVNAPVQVDSATDWKNFTAIGTSSYLATKTDGSLWAWGNNHYGMLGLGDEVHRDVPTQVGEETDWANVFAGYSTSFAIKSDGSLWAWGYNNAGELGVGDRENKLSPAQVGTDTDWSSVVGGYYHTLAIKSDGSLWAWGQGSNGRLGVDSELLSAGYLAEPTQVGTDTDWINAAAGSAHSLAVKSDGTLWAWGLGSNGQLGLGSTMTATQTVPVQVGLESDWIDVDADEASSFAVKSDGFIWAWGNNANGKLGVGDTTTQYTPVPVGL